MRAAILWNGGAPLEVRGDVTLAAPGPRDVRVRLAASGICHTDLSVIRGAIAQPRPCVLGHEGAGVVVEAGREVAGLAPGDAVILTSIAICGRCPACLRGCANLCEGEGSRPLPRHFHVSGERAAGAFGSGTFAEELVVSAAHAVRVDADVPLDAACLIGCGVMTGVGAALHAAAVAPGSSVAVLGAGGVGVAAIQGARIAGAAEIVAVDPVPGKRALAARFGATSAIAPDELAEAARERGGFDFALECVGHAAAIRAAFDAVRRGGTAVAVGAGRPDDPVRFSAFELATSEKRLRGSLYGSGDARVEFPKLVRLWRAGALDLEGMITRRIALEDVNEGLRALEAGEVIRAVIRY
jgi:S-(hydroxymethyl)glutathione dehydrogenase/alcohol dehydrogenase